jgi:hypothetical protein
MYTIPGMKYLYDTMRALFLHGHCGRRLDGFHAFFELLDLVLD